MKKLISAKGFIVVCMLAIVVLGWHNVGWSSDQAVIEAAKKEGKFVWYTSMPIEGAVAFLKAFKERYPFLDTSEYWRSNSFKVYSRINTETKVGKYITDVAHVALMPAYREWKQNDWLMKYDCPAYKGFPKEIVDPGYWAPFRTFAIVMAYSRAVLPEKEVPRTWSDLTDPKWKGLLAVEGVDSGSQQIEYYCLKKELGEGFWQKIAANKPREYSGTGAIMNALLRGEVKVAMIAYGYGVYRYRELEGSPIQGVWATEGVPINIAPMSIMAKSPHPNAAKLFMDFGLSKEGQSEMVKIVGAYSGRSDVPSAKGNPKWGSFKKLFVDDWDKFNAERENFKKLWMSMK